MSSTGIKKVGLLIGICLLLLTGIPGFHLLANDNIDPELWKKAEKIHREAIVIDTHCDTPMVLRHRKLDLGQKTDKNEVDFIRMKQGGLDAMFFAVFVSNRLDDNHPAKNALEMIDEIFLQVEKYPELAQMAFSPQDIRDIHRQGKRAILMGIENGGAIEKSPGLLRNFYRLGVRYITLTHNSNNAICDSAVDEEPKWNGLSPFGKEIVREMNRLGMLIDVSHISDKAFRDVIEVSEAPVFASHSCVRALCDAPRNMTDEMIKALAEKGGVIQINFYSAFLDEVFNRKSEETREKLKPQIEKLRETYKNDRGAFWNEMTNLAKKHGPEPPGINVLIDHIDHVVKLVGADYVGLGSDYDGAGSFPRGLEDVTGYPLITYHLLKRGYKEEDIKKILGGNFLRFFEEAIRAAGKNRAR